MKKAEVAGCNPQRSENLAPLTLPLSTRGGGEEGEGSFEQLGRPAAVFLVLMVAR